MRPVSAGTVPEPGSAGCGKPLRRHQGSQTPLRTADPLCAGHHCPLRTDKYAQMAADAAPAVEHGVPLLIQTQRLMTAVRAGDGTASAADAALLQKTGEENGAPIQRVGGSGKVIHPSPPDTD